MQAGRRQWDMGLSWLNKKLTRKIRETPEPTHHHHQRQAHRRKTSNQHKLTQKTPNKFLLPHHLSCSDLLLPSSSTIRFFKGWTLEGRSASSSSDQFREGHEGHASIFIIFRSMFSGHLQHISFFLLVLPDLNSPSIAPTTSFSVAAFF